MARSRCQQQNARVDIIPWSHRLEHVHRCGAAFCTRNVHAAENSVLTCSFLIWPCGMYGGLLTMPAMLPHMLCTGSYQEPVLTCISWQPSSADCLDTCADTQESPPQLMTDHLGNALGKLPGTATDGIALQGQRKQCCTGQR